MNQDDYKTCAIVIHGAAAAAGVGNAVAAVPGTGYAADVAALTGMALALCAVFGGDVPKEVARTMAVAALKQQLMRSPVRAAAKELAKFAPGAGTAVATVLSVSLVEMAGWAMAKDLARRSARA